MSLWADYIKEREGYETLENDRGFLTYKVLPDGHIFVRDMFVRKADRGHGWGHELFLELVGVATSLKVPRIMCQVDLRTAGATQSLGVILSRDFKIVNAEHQVILLVLDLEHGRSH